MVVRAILPNVVPGPALKARKVRTTDRSWGWEMRYRVVVCWGVHINWILPDSCCIGHCSHYFCIRDNGSDQPGSLSVETLGVLEDESSLKDSLLETSEMAWVKGGGNLW